MRVIIAGLFVYIGMMAFVAYLFEENWLSSVSPPVFAAVILLVIAVLAWVANRLFNTKSEISFDFDEPTEVDRDERWEFEFLSNASILLAADLAERQEITGMSRFFRGVAVFMGFVWASLPILFHESSSIWQMLISETLGIYVLYTFLVKPIILRYRIRKLEPTSTSVTLTVTFDDFRISSNGASVRRGWDELQGILHTPSGIVFSWENGKKNWLPIEAVGDKVEYQRFARYLFNRAANYEEELQVAP